MSEKNIDIGHLEESLEYFERLSSAIQGLEPISYDCGIPEATEYKENMELASEVANKLRRTRIVELEELDEAGVSLEGCIINGAAQEGVVKWYNITVKNETGRHVLSNNVLLSVRAVLEGYINILRHRGE